MKSWLGQYCINVTDLERSVAFYTGLGLTNTSRTEIPQALEAIVEHPPGGSKLQLAQQKEPADPFEIGTGFWKLYVNTRDIAATYDAALAAGAVSDESAPQRLEQWPVTIAFVRDPDGYLVELVRAPPLARRPADRRRPGSASTASTSPTSRRPSRSTRRSGLECTSRTEIQHAQEAIVERPGQGGKLQLAQQKDAGRPDPDGLDVEAVRAHRRLRLRSTGPPSTPATRPSLAPMFLDRWNTTIAFVTDPDGYQVELVQRHPD